jgi:hypothetical protein
MMTASHSNGITSLLERPVLERTAVDHLWFHGWDMDWEELTEREGLKVFARAKDSTLHDVRGREYLDSLSGLFVVNVGRCPWHWVDDLSRTRQGSWEQRTVGNAPRLHQSPWRDRAQQGFADAGLEPVACQSAAGRDPGGDRPDGDDHRREFDRGRIALCRRDRDRGVGAVHGG